MTSTYIPGQDIAYSYSWPLPSNLGRVSHTHTPDFYLHTWAGYHILILLTSTYILGQDITYLYSWPLSTYTRQDIPYSYSWPLPTYLGWISIQYMTSTYIPGQDITYSYSWPLPSYLGRISHTHTPDLYLHTWAGYIILILLTSIYITGLDINKWPLSTYTRQDITYSYSWPLPTYLGRISHTHTPDLYLHTWAGYHILILLTSTYIPGQDINTWPLSTYLGWISIHDLYLHTLGRISHTHTPDLYLHTWAGYQCMTSIYIY